MANLSPPDVELRCAECGAALEMSYRRASEHRRLGTAPSCRRDPGLDDAELLRLWLRVYDDEVPEPVKKEHGVSLAELFRGLNRGESLDEMLRGMLRRRRPKNNDQQEEES